MNKLEAAINKTMNRMVASEIYWFATGAVTATSIARGTGYENGPMLLVIYGIPKPETRFSTSMPHVATRHIKESDFEGTYSRLKDHRVQNPEKGVY